MTYKRLLLTVILSLLAAAVPAGASAMTRVAPQQDVFSAGNSSGSATALLVYGRDIQREALMEQYRALRTSHAALGLMLADQLQDAALPPTGTIYVFGEEAERETAKRKAELAGVNVLPIKWDSSSADSVPGLQPSASRAGLTYFMLRDVNPFLDLQGLQRKGEWLHERGIPFFVELRPVFVNTEMESMKSYYHVVRGLLEAGGIPLLGPLQGWAPPDEWQTYVAGSMATGVTDTLEPERLMKQAWDAYLREDIRIAGMAGPLDLMFDPVWEGIAAKSSLFVENGSWHGFSRDVMPDQAWRGIYLPFDNVMAADAAAGWGLPADSSRVAGVAASASQAELEAEIRNAEIGGVVYADASLVDGEISWGTEVARAGGRLFIDGELQLPNKAPADIPPPEAIPLPETEDSSLTRINKSIKSAMVVLLVVSILVIAAFASFFVIGRKINRRKFLR